MARLKQRPELLATILEELPVLQSGAGQPGGGDNRRVKGSNGNPGCVSGKETVAFLPQEIPVHWVNIKPAVEICLQQLPFARFVLFGNS